VAFRRGLPRVGVEPQDFDVTQRAHSLLPFFAVCLLAVAAAGVIAVGEVMPSEWKFASQVCRA